MVPRSREYPPPHVASPKISCSMQYDVNVEVYSTVGHTPVLGSEIEGVCDGASARTAMDVHRKTLREHLGSLRRLRRPD